MLADVFGLVMVAIAVHQIASRLPAEPGARVIHVLSGVVLLYGCIGFFAQAAASTGGLRFLPSSFEWPVLRPETTAVDATGHSVLGLVSSGRVQVYDLQDRFVRGWFVEAGGGTFKLQVTPANQIEVFTARGQRRLVYNPDGALVDKGTYAPVSYDAVVTHASTGRAVNAAWPLWPLASPFIAWALFASGLVVLILLELRARRRGLRF